MIRLTSFSEYGRLRPAHSEWEAATGAFSVGSYPTSKVRGRSREDPMPERRWPRGVTLCLTSGLAAKRSYPESEVRGGGQEEQPHLQGAVAAWAQEGLEKLSHFEGQEGQQ